MIKDITTSDKTYRHHVPPDMIHKGGQNTIAVLFWPKAETVFPHEDTKVLRQNPNQ